MGEYNICIAPIAAKRCITTDPEEIRRKANIRQTFLTVPPIRWRIKNAPLPVPVIILPPKPCVL